MTLARLAGAFAVATIIGLLGTPLARRLAVKSGFLDEPGAHKSHRRSIPYLGGLAIIVATAAGAVAGGAIGPTTGRILLVAILLGGVGLIDDSRPIGALPRLGSQILAAAIILGAGIRFQLTGSPITDGLFTLVWLVGITNAFNLLDNMDGLSAGTACLAAIGLAATALAVGQPALAVVALAVAGASLSFLAFNLRPATIFMGDAGSMFLGAMIAALTLAAHPPGSAPVHLVVPLLIVGLPVLDTVTVMLGRSRRGLSVMQGGRDHLSHRLVALGLRPRIAVRVLLLTEAASVVLAVMVTRDVIGPWEGLALAAIPLALLSLWTMRPRVYDDPVRGLPAILKWVVLGGGLAAVALSAPAALAMWQARGPLESGAASVQAGIQHDQAGDNTAAVQDFATAQADFAIAQHRLDGIAVSAGRVVPVMAINLRAARVLASVGLTVSRSGHDLGNGTAVQSLRIVQGGVNLPNLTRVAAQLRTLSGQLTASSAQVHDLPRTLLVPPIRRAVNLLDGKLATAAVQARQAADAATVMPDLLGAAGSRRYLLLIQNNAESRATGGLIGNFGELVTQDGHIGQGRFGRLETLNAAPGVTRRVAAPADYLARYSRFQPFEDWQNVNLSPDFATVGAVTASLYPKSGGSPVQGVIGIDPVALADMLSLTGPIQVPGWAAPITSANVVQLTLQGAYDSLPNTDRIAFLGQVAQAAFQAATTRDLGSPVRVAQALGPAVAQRHLQLYFTDPAEEAFAARLGASGGIGPAGGDQFLVTTQNSSANKVDYYLHRTVNYHLSLSPAPADPEGATRVAVRGTLDLVLRNDAPATGHSSDALGPYLADLQAGENRTFLSLYTPLAVTSASLDGRPLPLEVGVELGRNVFSAYVVLPAGATRTVTFTVSGSVNLAAGGWYTLNLPRQPTLVADQVSLTFDVPPGWQLRTGATPSGWSRSTQVAFTADTGRKADIQIRPSGFLGWLAPASSAPTSPPP